MRATMISMFCVLGSAFLWLGLDHAPNQAHSLSHLLWLASPDTSKVKPTGTHLWFIFRPADCKLTTSTIDSLNVLNEQGHISITGVMIDPPANSEEARRLVAEFHFAFEVLVDSGGGIAKAVRAEKFVDPLYLVTRDTQIIAAFTPAAVTPVSHLLRITSD